MSDYRSVLARLTALADEAAAHREEAQRWYAQRCAAADAAERAAEDAVRQAQAQVRAAQRTVDEVDAKAAGLWSDFVHRVCPAAERFGRTVPAPVVPRQRGDRRPDDYLQEAATRLAYTEPARPLTNATQLLFGLFGAVGGVIGAKRVTDRRGVPLDAAAVGVVLISGLVTVALLYAAVR